MNLSSVRGLKS
jgi:hypothetical protein